jgi:Flp pilus assembly pilin Flp
MMNFWGDCEPLTKVEKGIIITFVSALLIFKYKSAI